MMRVDKSNSHTPLDGSRCRHPVSDCGLVPGRADCRQSPGPLGINPLADRVTYLRSRSIEIDFIPQRIPAITPAPLPKNRSSNSPLGFPCGAEFVVEARELPDVKQMGPFHSPARGRRGPHQVGHDSARGSGGLIDGLRHPDR